MIQEQDVRRTCVIIGDDCRIGSKAVLLDGVCVGRGAVVAVREGGFVETIVDGETGFLVDRTARSMADAIQRLLVDPVLATQMGRQGRSMIEQRWTWKVAIDNLEKHLYEVERMSR